MIRTLGTIIHFITNTSLPIPQRDEVAQNQDTLRTGRKLVKEEFTDINVYSGPWEECVFMHLVCALFKIYVQILKLSTLQHPNCTSV